MKNPYNEVRANLQRSERLIAQYSEPTVGSAKQEILRRIEDHTLHVLVYGAYNAGKSTFVNALLEKACARVGDIPTTNRVESYDWDGYRLVDTPGINAPIEHEEITAAQLKRTQAVVVVVREGDQDAKDLYDRLFKMMSDKKEVFVVLNHEAETPEEIGILCDRIANLLMRYGGQHGVDEWVRSLPIFPVNLSTAWNGRSRQQAELTEHSGFTRFLNAFYDWTKNLDHETHHLDEVKAMVKNLWYDPALDECGRRRKSQDSERLAQLRDLEQGFVVRRNELHGEASRLITRNIEGIKSGIDSLLRKAQNESEFHQGIERIMEPVMSAVNQWLQVEVSTSSIFTATGSTSAHWQHGDGREGKAERSSGVIRELEGAARELAEDAVKKASDPQLWKGVFLKLRGTKTLELREFLRLKGKWHTTLGKYADNITGVVKAGAWLLNAGMAVYSVKRAHDEQERQNQQMVEAAKKHYSGAELVAGDLRRGLLSEVEGIIDREVDIWLHPVRSEIREIGQNASKQEEDCNQLADYQSQLEEIRF